MAAKKATKTEKVEAVSKSTARGKATSPVYGTAAQPERIPQGEIVGQIQRLFQMAEQLETDVRSLAEDISPILNMYSAVEENSEVPRQNMTSAIGDNLLTANLRLEAISEYLNDIRHCVAL